MRLALVVNILLSLKEVLQPGSADRSTNAQLRFPEMVARSERAQCFSQ